MNEIAHKRETETPVALDYEYAAMFYYVMRNCFAGIWRQNVTGAYDNGLGNAPSVLVDEELLRSIHRLLQRENVIFMKKDCFEMIASAQPYDVLYGDAPYDKSTVLYTKDSLAKEFQKELAFALTQAVSRGVMVMHSNASTLLVRPFYKEWNQVLIPVASRIGNNKNKHNDEVLFRSYTSNPT